MKKPLVMVGCPIYNRAWILPRWLDALAQQTAAAEIALAFCHTEGNDGTERIIAAEKLKSRFRYVDVYNFTGGVEGGKEHNWTDLDRLNTIAAKRNRLLDMARHSDAEFYLSLDSDVLVPDGGLQTLLDTIKTLGFDAVCPKVWIWDAFFVAAKYEKGKVAFLPRKITGVHPVDIVTSGACLMRRKVFENPSVQYGVSVLGTDHAFAPGSEINGWHGSECIAWSKSAKAAGFKLAANCNISFPHKMNEKV